jgi:hypothetical protein
LNTVNREIFAALKVVEFAFIQLAVDKIPRLLQSKNKTLAQISVFTVDNFRVQATGKLKCDKIEIMGQRIRA